jgi:YhcH/YjgK/YiaL family protein
MIYDTLDRLGRYNGIPRLADVQRFLARADVGALPPGDIPIDGDELYVKVLSYEPKPAAENFFETHRRYTDVQVVLRGREVMEFCQTAALHNHNAYDEAGDFQFFNASVGITSISVGAREFTVFSPGEAHKPGCRPVEPLEPVYKLVFKVRTRA